MTWTAAARKRLPYDRSGSPRRKRFHGTHVIGKRVCFDPLHCDRQRLHDDDEASPCVSESCRSLPAQVRERGFHGEEENFYLTRGRNPTPAQEMILLAQHMTVLSQRMSALSQRMNALSKRARVGELQYKKLRHQTQQLEHQLHQLHSGAADAVRHTWQPRPLSQVPDHNVRWVEDELNSESRAFDEFSQSGQNDPIGAPFRQAIGARVSHQRPIGARQESMLPIVVPD